jgi:hypothetical protein
VAPRERYCKFEITRFGGLRLDAIFILTVFGAVALLGLAVWPGLLEDVVFGFPHFLLTLPLLAFWFVLLLRLGLRDLNRPVSPARQTRLGLWSAGIMFATLGLLYWHIPQRLAFASCHAELKALADDPPTKILTGPRVGPFRVQRYGADRRGGVYFLTRMGWSGVGPDPMCYGFAYCPNLQGTPFGNQLYRVRHLFGGWYSFSVLDD